MVEERVQVIGHCAAEPAALWAVAGDFCGAWHPAIATMKAERDPRGTLIRAFTAKGEDTIYRERLAYRSDCDRVLIYEHVEGIAGAESYVARLAVSPDADGGSRVEWSARLTAEGERAAAIAAGTKAIFEMGIEALGCVDERSFAILKDIVAADGVALPGIFPSRAEIGKAEGGALNLEPMIESIYIEGNPRLAMTIALPGGAAKSLFSPWGEVPSEGEAMRGSRPQTRSSLEPLVPPRPSDPSSEGEKGALVLFLHGIGGNRANWLPQLAAAARHARAAALDLRGYGDSGLGPAQSTVDDYCADILRVAESLGADRLVLCGLSYGARIATSFAMRHPEKLAGLVLSGGCTGMSEAGMAEREAFRQSREVPLSQGKTPADFAPAVVNVLAGPDANDQLKQMLFASMAAIPTATYRDALTCFTNPPERFDFSRLTMPVLMMTGEHDRLAPPAEIRGVAARIAETAPRASVRFEVIAGAGHVCNVERPDAYNAILGQFLTEVAP